MTMTRFEEAPAREFLAEAAKLISNGAKESPLRHNLSAFLPRMFPNIPWWVRDHASCAEKNATFHKSGKTARGFVDALVGATAIEYEHNLAKAKVFEDGLGQVKDYCADLLNSGVPQALIIGVLSDTVNWKAYKVSSIKPISAVPGSTVFGRDHLTLDEIDSCDLGAAGPSEAKQLGVFLEKHLGRLGARRLDADTLASDLGFGSAFSEPHLVEISSQVDSAFSSNAHYAGMIEKLWKDFVSYLGGDAAANGFDRSTYIGELYILTLSKLVCANILSQKALSCNDSELVSILDGTFFQNRGLSNLVEYDYFGWLNAAPHVQSLIPVARAIQDDLIAYDFYSPPIEDLFGAMMAQLARSTQRLLLGQEWTPSWLAGKIVSNTIAMLPTGQEPRFVDMCCGSGAMVVETVKQVKTILLAQGYEVGSSEMLSKLSTAITGFDIDPLAVMLAKISWVLAAKDCLDASRPISIPVYHADSLFAATPVAQVVDESGVTHHEMQLDGNKVSLPAFLITPERKDLFDALLDTSYAVAMASAKSKTSDLTEDLLCSLVKGVVSSSESLINSDEERLLAAFAGELTVALEDLQRTGRNGIWAFILRNSYRPGLVAGKFNGLVSNPPWLALSKIADNPYRSLLKSKAEAYAIKPPGPAHLHVEMATIFLLHAVEKYLIADSVLGCILPESIMSGHQHTPFRAASFAMAPRPVNMRVDEIWRVEKGTFKNEAVVIFGAKAEPTIGNIKGYLVSRDGKKALTFKRIARGNRSAWSENKALGANNAGFFTPADFRQGADIFPRTLVFHTLQKSGAVWNASPISKQSNEQYLKTDAKTHKTFSMTVNGISDDVVFDILLSHHLTPFDICSGAKGILPIKRAADGIWTPLSLTALALKGKMTENAVTTTLTAFGQSATTQSYFEYIDTVRKKLINQKWATGWLVFVGAGGANVCAAYADATRFPQNNTIVDQTLYWTVVQTEDEAIYLTGLLNSAAVSDVIREFQPSGQFGKRHIHKLPFGATPPYDQTNQAHIDVVAKTKILMAEWAAFKAANIQSVQDLLNPNKSKLHIRRTKIREVLVSLPSWQEYSDACKAIYCIV